MNTFDKDGRPLEIERKFLIEYPDIAWLDSYPGGRRIEIKQIYFDTDSAKKLRVRTWKEAGGTRYILTKKTRLTDLTRIEEESELTCEEYEAMLAGKITNVRSIEKVRYQLPYKNKVTEVDIFPFWTDKALAEVELEYESEDAELPEEIRIIREVTEDSSFTNYNLCNIKGCR